MMRENSFYPPHPPPGLPRPPLSVTGPFPHFNPTPPRLQGYQRPQNHQVDKTILHWICFIILFWSGQVFMISEF